jgi:hypothetical protein
MNKVKFLQVAVFVLLTMNVVLVLFFMLRPDHPSKGKGPRNEIIRRLKFDEQQVQAYDELITNHRETIRKHDEKITVLKQDLYSLLSNSGNRTMQKDSLISEIGRSIMQIEYSHFNHFQDIRDLCSSDQLPSFDKLTRDLHQIFNRHRKERSPKK